MKRWICSINHVYTESTGIWTLFLLLSTVRVLSQQQINTPFWQITETWSSCSRTCGPGIERRQFQCVSSDIYEVLTLLSDDKCEGQPQGTNTNEQLERPCNRGACRGYRWRTSDWGPCSQTCGGFGTMSRDVDCVYTGKEGDMTVNEHQAIRYCGQYIRPAKHSPCNRNACPPDFVPEQWGKCIQSDPCRPGRQVRQVSCISIQVNGTHRYLPKAACYLLGRPQLPTWRRCFTESTSSCESQQPTIDTDGMTIVQMRKAKVLNLQVGQRAFVIPYTRLTIRCPVHYFSVHDIIWSHPNHGKLSYVGPAKDRITVDKRGRLHIRSFRTGDSGEWQCNAGGHHATITFISRTPAEGFHDWVQRNRLWTRGMMSDDPRDLAAVHAIVQWVEGPWSACSVNCGTTGKQYRKVRCERVDTRVYQILDDQACWDKLLPKPLTQRECLRSRKCPEWIVEGADPSVCTDRCIAVDQGSIKGNLTCRVGDRIVNDTMCESSEKPDMSCPNPICQVNWDIGPWSQCSRICGGVGVRARQLLCVWSHNKQPAGPMCYANQLTTPVVVEECQAPPCQFQCIDKSNRCSDRIELCKFTMYRYRCCETCRAALTKHNG